ncbi:MAG: reverse transcriptase/maturase family protein [bacterium]|nr:reverse transcriptase/maturase family protein [bacterium]
MGKISDIDLSLANIYRSWYDFRVGKRASRDIDFFSYHLETELFSLYRDLNFGTYRHGEYRYFTVTDSKRRHIAVANVRDRVVHRLLYNYLVEIYDQSFIYDVWSCRKNKGVIGAVKRTQKLLKKHPLSFVWRADITKFFDSVNQVILLKILERKLDNTKAFKLLEEVIASYTTPAGQQAAGIAIGNLTSQIFANVYLNELDHFVSHTLKPQAYIRYGDDFIAITSRQSQAHDFRRQIGEFLDTKLALKLNPKNNIIIPTGRGVHFLGLGIFPYGWRLNKRNLSRAKQRVNQKNVASYYGLVKAHSNYKRMREFQWHLFNKFNDK